jgi:hypothetical protein
MSQPYSGEFEQILVFLESEMKRPGSKIKTEDDVYSFIDASGEDFGLGKKPQVHAEEIIKELRDMGVNVIKSSTKDRIINSVLRK